MNENKIETRLVYGFLEAGKTTYIQDCIRNDYFHKYGTTLILCFEQGEEQYDAELLQERRSIVEFWDAEGEMNETEFCLHWIDQHHPDRIYVEMNTMIRNLRQLLPDLMNVTYTITWIDWKTLPIYFTNLQQMMQQMVTESQQIVFRGCPSRELLAPYGQAFRLMNHRAVYLRQDPMGYHEKAFDLFVPFSLEEGEIEVSKDAYLALWLDAADHPEHYQGKSLSFSIPLEIRQSGPDRARMAGRVVMTCCMADLQFMGFELLEERNENSEIPAVRPGDWIYLEAEACIGKAEYGRSVLKLRQVHIDKVRPPKERILSANNVT